jgi:hypothetical protein
VLEVVMRLFGSEKGVSSELRSNIIYRFQANEQWL